MSKPHDLQVRSGLRLADELPPGLEPLDVTLHYLTFYERDFARARAVVKRRARNVVVLVAVANGAIAILGAVVAVAKAPWLGLASTALAGFIGVVTAWDALFRHRELWVQRSSVLGRLQALKRTIELRRAAGEDRNRLAEEGMQHLNEILGEDLVSWTDMRQSQRTDRAGRRD